MKKFKLGFTLAEVLITLGIIGVVAAIVMPSVISSYQYKAVGVKLSKFASLVENATRPFVAQNDVFSPGDTTLTVDFINESFIITKISNGNSTNFVADNLVAFSSINRTALKDDDTISPVVRLKDGTLFKVVSVDNSALDDETVTGANIMVDFDKVGIPVFGFEFDPCVTGLPAAIQKTYTFVVTELGYVYPHADDDCLEELYQAGFASNARFYKNTTACSINTDGSSTPSS